MKTVKQNIDFIKKHPLQIKIEDRHLPGGAEHNLLCWLCNKNHAVYSMYPNWVFMPCWDCQKEYDGIWTEKKKWYQFWK